MKTTDDNDISAVEAGVRAAREAANEKAEQRAVCHTDYDTLMTSLIILSVLAFAIVSILLLII